MKAKILLINLAFCAILSSCSYWEGILKEADPTKGLSAAQIYGEGKAFLDVEDYPNAIKYFDILEARYPFGIYSTQSMLDLVYASYQSNLKDEAIVNADRFIRLYPNHPNVSYAYYLRALANFDKGQNFLTKIFAQDPSKYDVSKLRASFDDFSIVINKFPKSKYAKDSRNRLLYIKNMMAKNELYIAKYYVKRQAYIAAIERVKYLLTNYNGTPSTEEALLILIEGYNYLGMNDLASDTARVLKENYPDYRIENRNGVIIAEKEIKIEKKVVMEKSDSSSWFRFLNIYNYF
ncbi:MAG: outer membrane protein assembly factor BamD [Gammaproteobacteria bacterium]|jgi:outer membrane protein assembly factor BamD|nr:outer membrane protein assembly factor BamD [Gammaproteobacteria bacterium]MBT5405953.1 outer membrane protein assembly factor BamD [Gammaproteobacteria bacterium]MBT5643965.1 outer membrane protein assembly factor BamD [Gammaproteobacteria bacterium]MBT6734637.1 outer membrane protein assembly factor BamD [Gammaproteobacteria bacterium]MBT7237141.1 outer membrane protein assembly factor BamD [Gammaproteobacteria bacterium]|tara:strand:- start:3334 stop:4209 length:876 start_codon:yes stop_codon:yes gene_type:complete